MAASGFMEFKCIYTYIVRANLVMRDHPFGKQVGIGCGHANLEPEIVQPPDAQAGATSSLERTLSPTPLPEGEGLKSGRLAHLKPLSPRERGWGEGAG